jgi:DNA/RNA endonuclease G (NUC1)
MKFPKLYWFVLVMALAAFAASCQSVPEDRQGTAPWGAQSWTEGDLKGFYGMPVAPAEDQEDTLLIRYHYYVTDFNLRDNAPVWGAYTVTSLMVQNKLSGDRPASNPLFKRPRFWTDPTVREADTPRGYTPSVDFMFVDTMDPNFPLLPSLTSKEAQKAPNYIQRGHIVPNDAMKQCGDLQQGVLAQKESFSLANVVPEMAAFNSPAWSKLENMCFAWAKELGQVWVVVGPIYDHENPTYLTKRVGGAVQPIVVPDAVFCVVIGTRDGHTAAIGFVIDHKPEGVDFKAHSCPVDEIEDRTGMNFMPDLGEPCPAEASYDPKWLATEPLATDGG